MPHLLQKHSSLSHDADVDANINSSPGKASADRHIKTMPFENLEDTSQTSKRITHIIGAGLAGLSAAVKLASSGHPVAVHEATQQAGGRCRSYFDASFGSVIDNGNHLVLSGNEAVARYCAQIGSLDQLQGPQKAEFAFADIDTGRQWTLRINQGRLPYWLLNPSRRVPDTSALDYLGAAKLMFAGSKAKAGASLRANPLLYTRLWQPLMLAALNTDPDEGSARLAWAIMRGTLAKGGAACRPLIATGLSEAFIEPALKFITDHGGTVHFGHRLKHINFVDNVAVSLSFGDETVSLAKSDRLICAVPPWISAQLLPDIQAPDEFRAIVNAHFKVEAPKSMPQIVGVIGGTVEWIFAFPGRISITVSGADRLIDRDREELAQELWRDVAAVTGLAETLPPWQIVKEKRATFAATPEQDQKRPAAKTKWDNVVLAGDWTQTGLPATIEGAIRSGEKAADLAVRVK